MSYIIDVYRGTVKCEKSFYNYLTYTTLFPQIIAGPIVRYETVDEELETKNISLDNFSKGMKRFLRGLGKKVLIANNVGALWNIIETGAYSEMSSILAWTGIIAFALQIYFDFSGYSDMAIGLANIFGMDFDENFNFPYISKSITEFWRRWHITLGSWFRDYIYIPLGGNRKGFIKQIRNIAIVWFLTGAWHGASWNFILWGLYFGVILIIEKVLLLKDYIIALFAGNNIPFVNNEGLYYFTTYLIIILIGIFLSIPVFSKVLNKLENSNKRIAAITTTMFYIGVLVLSTASLVSDAFNPFLYFRF